MNSRLIRPAGLILLFAVSITAIADDWPQWRGPDRDGKSKEANLLKEWPEGGPPLAWKATGIGGGYSTVSVANGKIYTLGDSDNECYAIALNESDGSEVWRTNIGQAGGHKAYPGSRSTPTVDGGQVFVLSEHGELACLNATDGEKLWSTNLEGDFNGNGPKPWKYSESPLVDGNQVVCTPGGKDGTMLALDRNSGKQIWRTTEWTDQAAYSSIIIATIGGVRQYVQLTGRSVAGVDPESGTVLWRADRQGRTAVIPTPVVSGNTVFVTSGYGVGCNGFRITRDDSTWNAEEIYSNQNISNHHGGVVLLNGYVFGTTGDTFRCVEVATGENGPDYPKRDREVKKGSIVYADGLLYLRCEKGPVALIKATQDEFTVISSFDQPDRSGKQMWPHPVIANGKLYLRDQDLLLCYDVKQK